MKFKAISKIKSTAVNSQNMDVAKLGWIGWLLTAITWIVSISISLYIIKRNERREAVNKIMEVLISVEDDTLDYWINRATNVQSYQLNLKLKRVTILAQKAVDCGAPAYPTDHILALRKAATLMSESDSRPITRNDVRARQIMLASEKLQRHYLNLS